MRHDQTCVCQWVAYHRRHEAHGVLQADVARLGEAVAGSHAKRLLDVCRCDSIL